MSLRDAEKAYLAALPGVSNQRSFARSKYEDLDNRKLRREMYREQRSLCIYCERQEIYVRSDVPLPDATRRALELAIVGRTDGARVRRSIVNLNDPALVKARSAAVRGERKRLAKDSESTIVTGDKREERASQLLGRRHLPEFVSIRVASLRKTLGRGR